MNLPFLDLPALAGVVGAAAALVVATAVLLNWLNDRFVPLFVRHHALCADFCCRLDFLQHYQEERDWFHASRSRLGYLGRASDVLCLALLCAVTAIVTGLISALIPGLRLMPLVALGAVLVGAGLFAVGLALLLTDLRLERELRASGDGSALPDDAPWLGGRGALRGRTVAAARQPRSAWRSVQERRRPSPRRI